ncbi:hypothetical protein ACQEXU_08090 [Vibrio sp. TRT 21S02]|uniref:nucleotide-binding protein n=1 Tax=Vibrio sp. TRT 21S02 TaxID=3418507 RepID=UPI003CF8E53C
MALSTQSHALTVAAFVLNQDDGDKLEKHCADLPISAAVTVSKACPDMTTLVSGGESILIVEMDPQVDVEDFARQLLQSVKPTTAVVLLGESIETESYRRLLHLGIKDYLATPIDHDALKLTIERIGQLNKAMVTEARGIVVWGMKGGVGTTMIAANLAFDIATSHARETLIVDSDPLHGAVGLALNQENYGQLSSVLTYAEELDDLLFKRSLVDAGHKLSLLNDTLELGQMIDIHPYQMKNLAEYANRNYTQHIWDSGNLSMICLDEVIRLSKVCVLVTDLSLNATRSLAKALKHLEAFPHVRPIIVVSSVRKDDHHWFTQEELEKSLNVSVDYQLPHAAKLMTKAHELGDVVAKGDSPWAKSLKSLSRDCLGLAKGRKSNRWMQLFGGGR